MSIKARGKRISFKNIVTITPWDSILDPEEEFIEDVGNEEESSISDALNVQKQKEESNSSGLPVLQFGKLTASHSSGLPVLETEQDSLINKENRDNEEWEQLMLF
jgi:hypothetical protein